MPWTINDVEQHKAGLTDAEKQRWVSIANRVLEECLEDGDEAECEARAIRIANSVLNEAALLDEQNWTAGIVPLIETKIGEDGTLPIKIISVGWGETGYYGKEVLERDGPKIFRKGMHSYWNHPSTKELRERPEGDLNSLAGVLSEDAKFHAQHAYGPGLYSRVKVKSGYKKDVQELGPHIGMSIRASGKVKEGEAEGRSGLIVQEITRGRSVDFVTQAGAGGRVLELFEAAGEGNPETGGQKMEELEKLQEELKTSLKEGEDLREAMGQLTEENAQLRKNLVLKEAKDVIAETLVETSLPELAQQRISTAMQKNVPMLESGELDTSKLTEAVKDAAKAEAEYLKAVTGNRSGGVQGLGESSDGSSEEDDRASLLEAFKNAGFSDELAEVAARGRGRK